MEMGARLVKSDPLKPLSWLGGLLLDTLYPPTCLACDAPVATADTLCATCFRALRPISAPLCPVLGIPFEVSLGPGALSAEAIADPPPYDRSRSAVIYNEAALALVGKLKYGDRPELARFCARLMAQAGHGAAADAFVPGDTKTARMFGRHFGETLHRLAAVAAQPSGDAVSA